MLTQFFEIAGSSGFCTAGHNHIYRLVSGIYHIWLLTPVTPAKFKKTSMIILTSYAGDYTSPVFFIKPVFVTSPGKGGIANHFAMLYSNRKLYAEMYKSLRNLILRKTGLLLLVWELAYVQSQWLVSLL